jgi:hypothetical protein
MKCEICEGRRYIEVTHADDREYIEPCPDCMGYLNWQIELDQAVNQALADGYRLECHNRVVCPDAEHEYEQMKLQRESF